MELSGILPLLREQACHPSLEGFCRERSKVGFGVKAKADRGAPSVSFDRLPVQEYYKHNLKISQKPFLPKSWLDQYAGPASLDLEEECVRVRDQVVSPGLDEDPIVQLRLEDHLVQENILAPLAEAEI